MHKGMRKTTVFSYLHEDMVRTYPCRRLDINLIETTLPHPISRQPITHIVPWNERDQRVLLVFDGDLPFGVLPRSAQQVLQVEMGLLKRQANNVRHRKEGESPVTYIYTTEDAVVFATVRLHRRFLLMQSSDTVVCRYHANLAPWYAHVGVRKLLDGQATATWRNT
jgi:hypothetical protein